MTPPETQANTESLNDQVICDYLTRHPDFFMRNAALVEQMAVPHPVRGTISLVEWHMARARHRISELEYRVTMLMEQASANEQLFYRLLKLQGRLASADNLKDMLHQLHQWAREMGLAGAFVRLFSDRWRLNAPLELVHLALNRQMFEPLRLQRLSRGHHYLGVLTGAELSLILPQVKTQGSVALSLLGEQGDLGVVMFTSRDPQHYQAGQGTQLLQEISLLLPDLLQRWVERQ